MHSTQSIICSTGKDTSLDESSGVTHAVVLRLVEGLEHKGHHVYMDNYYSSPALFSSLQQLRFGACGTVRVNRRGLPKEVMGAKLKKGDMTSSEIKNNTYMGGVDKGDQLMSYYGFSHRTIKWWRRAFFENAIVNAYILYRLSTQQEISASS